MSSTLVDRIDVAALALFIMQLAEQDDFVAENIIAEAAEYFAMLDQQLLQALDLSKAALLAKLNREKHAN